ncbi:MAG TPA: tRNA lysidine(34) synthetase TilS [Balneolaceae bacterium]|nr:tRNA lysidine(34) synthetase TilS [Balneolaceae bacterium]
MAKSISEQIQTYLFEQLSDVFEKDAFFILGVSGGPDSMALMYLFYLLKQDALIVHINYGKRGKQSDKDQELVEQMAFAWGFECCSVRLNPQDAGKENFQNWARKQRYQFFEDLKSDYKADAIVTAHHQDDQVETVLQKILRGSSPAAWKGMELWDGRLFRPLLPFSKEEILDFCEAEAVPYRIDDSNEESGFARNFIRHELAGEMDRFFPGWQQNLLALEQYAEAYEESIRMVANRIVDNNTLDVERFSALAEPLKTAVLKFVLDDIGLEHEYSKGELEELRDIEALQTGKSKTVGSVSFTRDRGQIIIHSGRSPRKVEEQISEKEVKQGWSKEGIRLSAEEDPDVKPDLRLDKQVMKFPLSLRSWKQGDAFQPLGMQGHQKVSDHLTNRKIPTISREKALVLCGSDGTIYAIIYPLEAANGEHGAIADTAKVKASTQTILSIKVK